MKPRLLPSVTIALSIVFAMVLFNAFGLRPDDGDGPSYSISGRAVPSGSEGLPEDLWVRISWEEGRGVRALQVPVKADGSFHAEKLRPGDYRIEAVWKSGRISTQAQPATVAVRDRDVTGIEIRM